MLNEEYEGGSPRHKSTREDVSLPQYSAFLPYFGKEDYNRQEIENDDAVPGDPYTVEDIRSATPASEFWHPLRFGGYSPEGRFYPEGHFSTPSTPVPDEQEHPPWAAPTYEDVGLKYKDAARLSGTLLRRMVSSNMEIDDDISVTIEETDRLAMTNQYLADIVDEIRRGGDDVGFEDIYDQAKMIHDLIENGEGRYVVAGTAENPRYARVDNRDIIDQVWRDEAGEYDNFVDAYFDQNASKKAS